MKPLRALITLLVVAATFAWPVPPVSAEGPTFAIRAGKVYPVSPDLPEVMEGAVVVIEDGKVAAVLEAGAPVPGGLFVLDLPDATIIPGLVGAHSGLAGTASTSRSVSGAFAATDAVDVYADHRRLLAQGVTAVHVNPGEQRLVSGRGGVVKLAGAPEARSLARESDLAVNFIASATNPPKVVDAPVPPSADNMIDPGRYQRPGSRIEYRLALQEALADAFESDAGRDGYDHHRVQLREAWERELPLRIRADAAPDVLAGVRVLREQRRAGYVVGGRELGDSVRVFGETGVPLVYLVDASYNTPASDLGGNPEAGSREVQDLSAIGSLAIAPSSGSMSELRLAAALAQRRGVDRAAALAAITRTPAELMGVGGRIGSIEAGKDADLVVLSGEPLGLTSRVQRVFVDGRQVYAVSGDALVVRAATVWLGPDDHLSPGEVLIEDGVITAVGSSVARPIGARFVDAGTGSFVTPGLIDAFGHLALGSDRSSTPPNFKLSKLIGTPDAADRRVARSGVTTVLTGPYSFNGAGSQVAALKSGGVSREDRVVTETAAIAFDVRGASPESIEGRFKGRFEAGKKYLEKWEKYDKDLAEWREAREAGKAVKQAEDNVVEEATEGAEEDPVTGTWMMRATAPPMPPPGYIEGRVSLKLTGTAVEGRVIEPEAAEVEHRIVGVLDGTTITGTIEVDAPMPGVPTFTLELDGEDCTGVVDLGPITIDITGQRINKKAVEFKVARKRRKTGKDGRPLPPPVDDALEPFRLALEHKIPVLVRANTPAEIEKSLDALVGPWGVHVVILDGADAGAVSDRVRGEAEGVILPRSVIRTEDFKPYHQGDALWRAGIDFAFQSGAADGARSLPDVALYAVGQGLSPEHAIEALTRAPARMFGLDSRVGHLAKGCEGDLVIWSGHPLDPSSVVERVIVSGREVKP